MNLVTKIKGRLEEEYARLAQLSAEKWYSHSPPVRFAIISNIRSGSTMLQQLLNSHPNCRCFFELFHRHKSSIAFGVKGYRKRSEDPRYIKLRNEDPAGFLEQMIYQKQPRYFQAVGFKLLYPQCRKGPQFWESEEYAHWWKEVGVEPKWESNERCIWEFLASQRIKIIHLTRENILESKVSAVIAQRTGKWGIGATGGMRTAEWKEQIWLDKEEFIRDVRGEYLFRKETRERFAKNPLLEVRYEVLTFHAQNELSSILKFLNLPSFTLHTPTIKSRNYQLQEIIGNYDEIISTARDLGLNCCTENGK